MKNKTSLQQFDAEIRVREIVYLHLIRAAKLAKK